MYYKKPEKYLVLIPSEILRAMAEESVAQEHLPREMIESCVEKNLVPMFTFRHSNDKYGESEEDRIIFWQNVLHCKQFSLFFEKFPKTQLVEHNGEKFML